MGEGIALTNQGYDVTKWEEATALRRSLDRNTSLSDTELDKIWQAIYRGSLRGLKL